MTIRSRENTCEYSSDNCGKRLSPNLQLLVTSSPNRGSATALIPNLRVDRSPRNPSRLNRRRHRADEPESGRGLEKPRVLGQFATQILTCKLAWLEHNSHRPHFLRSFYKPFTPSLCACPYYFHVDNLTAEAARGCLRKSIEKGSTGEPMFQA